MTVKQIDDLARHKLDPGEELITMLEAGLLWNLRRLYDAYDASKGVMTADDAKAEKDRIIKQYEADYTALSEYCKLIDENGELMRRISQYTEIFKQEDAQRVKLSPLIAEANKSGCEICKKIAKVYDGRK